MAEIVKFMLKTLVTAVFWVFVLSIRVEGRPIFFKAHEILIENQVVRQLDRYLVELWDKTEATAVRAYNDFMEDDETTTF